MNSHVFGQLQFHDGRQDKHCSLVFAQFEIIYICNCIFNVYYTCKTDLTRRITKELKAMVFNLRITVDGTKNFSPTCTCSLG